MTAEILSYLDQLPLNASGMVPNIHNISPKIWGDLCKPNKSSDNLAERLLKCWSLNKISPSEKEFYLLIESHQLPWELNKELELTIRRK